MTVQEVYDKLCFTNTLGVYDHNMELEISEENADLLKELGKIEIECIEGFDNMIYVTIPENTLIEYYD